MKYIFLLLLTSTFLFSQTWRENFVGGYDVTVDQWNSGALVSYWKAIKFSPIVSARIDTLKWGYISHATGTIDSICMAVWSADEVNDRPDTLMFWGLVTNWVVPAIGDVDIAIHVTNIESTDSLSTAYNYFISMHTSSTGANLLARGSANTCNPNPRKIGATTSIVAPPPAGGSMFNVLYNNNCYGWGVYSAESIDLPPSSPSGLQVEPR